MLTLRLILVTNSGPKYAMTVKAAISETHMEVNLTYWTASISECFASKVGNTFNRALGLFLDGAKTLVSDIQLLSEDDLASVHQWNDTWPETVSACVQDVFEQRVATSPHSEAICSRDANFTYAELDLMSAQLSDILQTHNVGIESLVPICFDKSPWAVIAMLAVLKAGGGFVPLDPSHPADRRREILDQVGAKLVLVSSRTASLCSGLADTLIEVSCALFSSSHTESAPSNAIASTTKGPLRIKPSNIAYVLFTSGSTGKPKGVMVEHGPLCSSIAAHSKVLGSGPCLVWSSSQPMFLTPA